MVSPGGYRKGETPVPIPNTEVKPLIADGTARVTVWESRTLPGLEIITISTKKAGTSVTAFRLFVPMRYLSYQSFHSAAATFFLRPLARTS